MEPNKSEPDTNQPTETRSATIPESPDAVGAELGVCLYLTPTQLNQLGIDLNTVAEVEYSVNPDTGQLELDGITDGGGE